MRGRLISTFLRRTQGQSMIETALLLPILLLIAFNAINFGYFFFVALNVAAAPRSGVQYSILGFATPAELKVPDPGPAGTLTTVSHLTYQDMTGVLTGAATSRVQVCSVLNGLDGQFRAKCCETASSTSACSLNTNVAGNDPEYTPSPPSSRFIRHQVDVYYALTPIIPSFRLQTPAGSIPLTVMPNLTVHRQVSMRLMN